MGNDLDFGKDMFFDFTKVRDNLKNIDVEISWEQNPGLKFQVDVDVAAIFLKNGKIFSRGHVVYFNNTVSPESSIALLTKDERSGGVERLGVDLSTIPVEVDEVLFVAAIHDAKAMKQTFGNTNSLKLTVIDKEVNKSLLILNLQDELSSAVSVVAGSLVRHGDHMDFSSHYEGSTTDELQDVVKRFI